MAGPGTLSWRLAGMMRNFYWYCMSLWFGGSSGGSCRSPSGRRRRQPHSICDVTIRSIGGYEVISFRDQPPAPLLTSGANSVAARTRRRRRTVEDARPTASFRLLNRLSKEFLECSDGRLRAGRLGVGREGRRQQNKNRRLTADPKPSGEAGRQNKDKGSLDKDKGRLDRDKSRLDKDKGRLDKDNGRLDKDNGRLDKDKGRLDKDRGRLDRDKGRLDKDKGRLDKDSVSTSDSGSESDSRGEEQRVKAGSNRSRKSNNRSREGGRNRDNGNETEDSGGLSSVRMQRSRSERLDSSGGPARCQQELKDSVKSIGRQLRMVRQEEWMLQRSAKSAKKRAASQKQQQQQRA
ncbi:hypothetical protein BOX15_Mlig020271g1 [Macrostomum lignano]|uniref:Uncharacterized protein n=1 Tax=Macrostomum lignano TaxID=282301 RepID=A0A267DQ41_9PLAT|nr:hypothetical protein BOX15_Mlig020271g1 [Macrostomum lignano]